MHLDGRDGIADLVGDVGHELPLRGRDLLGLLQRDAQAVADSLKAKRSRKAQSKPRPSPDETAAFYAAKVNSNEYLPQNMISAAMCGLMLECGLVTPERLRMRGVR